MTARTRLLGLSFLVALHSFGCASSSTEERLEGLERQMTNVQVLDLRLGAIEERLQQAETDIGELKAGPAKKAGGKAKPAPTHKEPAPIPAPKPAPAPQEASPAPVAPQPVEQTPHPAQTEKPVPPAPGPNSLGTEPYLAGGRKIPAPQPSAPAGQAPAAAAPSAESSKGAPPSAPQTAQAAPRPIPSEAPQKTPAGGEKGAYAEALARYEKGSYAQAESAFTAFLGSYPNSSLAPNAMYWLGECRYSSGRFSDAILTFRDVAAKYPKHPKTAAALLKAGYAYARLNDMENAKFYWQILLDDFPGSAPAQLAAKRMKE